MLKISNEVLKNGNVVNTYYNEKGKCFVSIKFFTFVFPNILEYISRALNESDIVLIDLKISDLGEKEDNRKKIIISGTINSQVNKQAEDKINTIFKNLVDEQNHNIIDFNFPFQIKIGEDYLIQSMEYPLISQHSKEREAGHGIVISNRWFTRLINEMTYHSNINLGSPIAQAAYVTGIRLGVDVLKLYRCDKDDINTIVKDMVLAYGYADISEIKQLKHESQVIGYNIKVKDSFFRYYPQLNDRVEVFDGLEIHVRDQADAIFGTRNCFFDRDLLLGIFQVIEFPDKNYEDVTRLSIVLSDMDSFEYKLTYNNLSAFDKIEDFYHLKQKDSFLNEQLKNQYCNRKKRTNLSCDSLKWEHTCSIKTGKDLCEFWIFKKSFLYDLEKYKKELYEF